MVLEAIAARPANGHNAHMVMHAYYEKGDPVAAQAFLSSWLPSYPEQALMWGHLQWHWALTELAMGRDDLALQRLLGPILDYLPRGTPFHGTKRTPCLSALATWDCAELAPQNGVPLVNTRAASFQKDRTHSGNYISPCLLPPTASAENLRTASVALSRWCAQAIGARKWLGVGQLHFKALIDGDTSKALKQFDACRGELPRVGGSNAQRSIVEETWAALRIPAAETSAT